MKVLKFGGGVLKNAESVNRLCNKIIEIKGELLIVVSAFGKTTGDMEQILSDYYSDAGFSEKSLMSIKDRYKDIIADLLLDSSELIFEKLDKLFSSVSAFFKKGLSENKYYEYDRIVSKGEEISVLVVTEALKQNGVLAEQIDSRKYIKTDSRFGDAQVNWDETQKRLNSVNLFKASNVIVAQGFVGSDLYRRTTTLGREGSDYSAAVYAYCLNAEEIIFYKNVPGIYNADPELYRNPKLLPKISYREAVEQTFYGAKILHPKTIKPLQNKRIPLIVKHFSDETFPGTFISGTSASKKEYYPKTPVYIVKNDQILISVSSNDFSFIAEDNLSDIFALLSRFNLKVSVMENSAISFSFCVNNVDKSVEQLITELKKHYLIKYNKNLSLITIRHYTQETIEKELRGKEILLRQLSRFTARFVVKNGSGSPVFRYNFPG